MLREVTLRYGEYDKTYPIEADSYYAAKMEALGKFLEEFKIPGKPFEYLTRKKGLIEITARSSVDRRTFSREGPQPQFYTEQVERLRKWIREGDLPETTKVKATKLLLRLGEVLGGQAL